MKIYFECGSNRCPNRLDIQIEPKYKLNKARSPNRIDIQIKSIFELIESLSGHDSIRTTIRLINKINNKSTIKKRLGVKKQKIPIESKSQNYWSRTRLTIWIKMKVTDQNLISRRSADTK